MSRMITIIGEKGVGKTTLFRQITKKYSTNVNKKPTPAVNYVEEIINIENNNYKLIDTPQFVLSTQTEIETAKKKSISWIIKKKWLNFVGNW